MRRYASTGSRKDLMICARLLESAPGKSHAGILMSGFETAMKGRSQASLPESTDHRNVQTWWAVNVIRHPPG